VDAVLKKAIHADCNGSYNTLRAGERANAFDHLSTAALVRKLASPVVRTLDEVIASLDPSSLRIPASRRDRRSVRVHRREALCAEGTSTVQAATCG
jgi:predicted transcriptional regulator